jgi:hypothetical protein
MDDGVVEAIEVVRPRWPLIGVLQLMNGAALLGALLLFGVCGYRRIWHPDWSGLHAVSALWPLYVAGGLPIVVRCAMRMS